MKLLLDENLPKKLIADFPNHEVVTVLDMGGNGIKNGPLLQLMLEQGFHALLTFDKNLQHQQNLKKYAVTVFVLSTINNTYLELTKLSPKVHSYLNAEPLPVGPIIITS